ncbi:hypothetical protein HPP92_022886 [Vanilla planifolia]|uniref:RanBP2-type domain-containing protein n=1 Tax=Vanilla planifolia TaxID=51239 RepID=A0A835UFU5_VANPL|nr:hypothetical protein HPP92_022886 [Vanilla planifolia]
MNRKAGDWNCRCCQHLNFGRRDACQRCGDPRIGAGVCTGGEVRQAGTVEVKPGDWYCTCGVHNFASRQSCFKCGSSKCEDGDLTNAGYFEALSSLHAVLPPGWKSGWAAMSITLRVGQSAIDAIGRGNTKVVTLAERNCIEGMNAMQLMYSTGFFCWGYELTF